MAEEIINKEFRITDRARNQIDKTDDFKDIEMSITTKITTNVQLAYLKQMRANLQQQLQDIEQDIQTCESLLRNASKE